MPLTRASHQVNQANANGPTHRPLLRHSAAAALLACSALVLSACGGGDGDSGTATAAATQAKITGVAATGAAINGATVTVTNANGVKATGTTGADGSFSIDVAEAAPYILSVADAATGRSWYSYAAAAGRANITPLTTLALLSANANKPLADLASNWSSAKLSDSSVLGAAAKVNAHLRSVMAANNVSANSANIFSDAFSANHTGLDAVLDAIRVNLDCSATSCTQTIKNPAGEVLVTWDGNIATTGITLSWTASSAGGSTSGGTTAAGTVTVGLGSCKAPKAGTYSMVVQTAVTGLPTAVPDVCVDGVQAMPAAQGDFCGGADYAAQLPTGVTIQSCTFSGNQGKITAVITSPIQLSYTVTYTFVRN